jgi:hypothetical protein
METDEPVGGAEEAARKLQRLELRLELYRGLYRGALEKLKADRRHAAAACPARSCPVIHPMPSTAAVSRR